MYLLNVKWRYAEAILIRYGSRYGGTGSHFGGYCSHSYGRVDNFGNKHKDQGGSDWDGHQIVALNRGAKDSDSRSKIAFSAADSGGHGRGCLDHASHGAAGSGPC